MIPPPENQLPRRASLPDQVVAVVREGITTARWRHELPSEAELCRELQVSRVTLRKALAQLVRERWIVPGGRGRHHRIRRQAARRVAVTARTIRVLSPRSPYDLGTVQQEALETLAERITADGYRMEFENRPQLFTRHDPHALERLGTIPDTAGWILFYSKEPMQRWFASSGIPCVVAGPIYDGVALSCVNPDASTTGRHAAGRLYARGYRELAFLTIKGGSLGAARSVAGFLEEASRLSAVTRIVHHGWDAESVRGAMDQLLLQRTRADGFFVLHAGHAVTVLCCLLRAGLQIPAEAGIIAGWDDPVLDFTTPVLARYRVDGVKFGRKLASTMLEQLQHGPGKLRHVRITPEFVPGGTIRDPERVEEGLRRQ